MITRERLNSICTRSIFREPVTPEEESIYCRFCEFVELDLHRQLTETGIYIAPDDYYAAFISRDSKAETRTNAEVRDQ